MAKKEETNLQNGILVALSNAGHLPWRNQVGVFRAYDNPQRIIKIGTPGMADIIDVVPVVITPEMVGKTVGVAVAMEIKTLTGQQRENQQLWELALKKRGGIYLVTRSIEQALQQIASMPDIICNRSKAGS